MRGVALHAELHRRRVQGILCVEKSEHIYVFQGVGARAPPAIPPASLRGVE